MKLLLYTEDEFSNLGLYVNTWIDENKIDGFYMPNIDDEIPCINILFCGEVLTVVQNEEIINFLNNKFNVYGESKATKKSV